MIAYKHYPEEKPDKSNPMGRPERYVFNKDGVYWSLTPNQIDEALIALQEVKEASNGS